MKLQSKLPFNGIDTPSDNYETYALKHKELLLNKLINLGLVVLEVSNLLMYEPYYD